MAPSAKKILTYSVLILLGTWNLELGTFALASSKTSFAPPPVRGQNARVAGRTGGGVVRRQWVVKLKQNSLMNRRPFQFATPVADGGMVFVGVQRGIFYGIDGKRGKKLWNFRTQGPIHARARVQGDAVYVPDTKGDVYAFNKETGSLIWVTKLEGEIMSAPLVHENKLYVVNLSKELTAVEVSKGTLLWKTRPRSKEKGLTVRGSADPVLVGGNILVGFSDGALAAYDPQSGQIRWEKQLGDRSEEFHDVDATILIAGPLAYVSSADGKLFALNPQNGQTVWQAPIGGANDAFLQDSFLYVTAGGVVYCLAADTGKAVWEQNLDVPEISSPAVYGPWLTVAATKGKIYFLDRTTGDVRHFWYVKGGSYSDPVIHGNQLFLLSNASRLYSFEFR